MMSEGFGSVYGDAYDELYRDKDYVAECDLIERILQTYAGEPLRSILDLGCGTGNHAIPLAQRGYEVVGVDHSISMLASGRRKLAILSINSRVTFHQGDIRAVELHRHFDAALMMFAVLGYQLENADVLAALRTARRHLRSGGLLLFDVWYGPAVLHQGPSERVKVIHTAVEKIRRVSSGELDNRRHICKVDFHIWRYREERLIADSEESHHVRYFFPLELEHFLECSGFAPLRLGAFPEFEKDPNETTWNILAVARAA